MKSGYAGKTVKYYNFNGYENFLERIKDKKECLREPIHLTELKLIYIVVE